MSLAVRPSTNEVAIKADIMICKLKHLLGCAFVLAPLALQGQWAVTPEIVVAIPQQKFANVGQTGGGFGIKVERAFNFHRRGLLLRGDFAFVTFGRKTSLLQDDNGNIILDRFGPVPVETRNEGFRLTGGPQYTIGGRNVRANASISGGIYYFRTNTSFIYADAISAQRFQNLDGNWALGWNGGIGLQFDAGLGPWLELGFEYQTMHNLPGPGVDAGELEPGVTAPKPPDITAHEYTLRFGVVFFLGK